jgi:hypothetical protein
VWQGAAWSAVEKVAVVHDAAPGPVAGRVGGRDIPGLAQLAGEHWTGDTAVYSHRQGEQRRHQPGGAGGHQTAPLLKPGSHVLHP